ncbi:hypothetical protein [Photobacterium sanguinicancri]|uniref:DUF3135 domain-containing protein n=2 Tax=Photobacterium sanguinicancri TaxID=875932 RepID=A0AAW7YDL1_9GAMM|nr:hypothetical protein [Photobacterium sanguinicancri]KXI23487.1 hypothetical protein AS132_07510 [Photobacterium sanguinicancri]MDO6545383.1 hypothetical protein [Photobacterium sanguinicancri]OZS42844.1 hypothetical protein ASV53_16260 [Photobacterium sanguinicancri]
MEHSPNDLIHVIEQCKQTIDLQDKSHSNPYLIPNPELEEYFKLQYSQLECAKHHVETMEQLLNHALHAIALHDDLATKQAIQDSLLHINAKTEKITPIERILCEPALAG